MEQSSVSISRVFEDAGGTDLPALRGGVRLLVLVGAHAKVLDGFPGVPLATEQDGVRASGCPDSESVESQDFTTSLEDALLSGLGEAESGDRELGDLGQTDIVSDGADLHDDLRVAVFHIGSFCDDFREGDGGLVDLGKEEAVEDGLLFHINNLLLNHSKEHN